MRRRGDRSLIGNRRILAGDQLLRADLQEYHVEDGHGNHRPGQDPQHVADRLLSRFSAQHIAGLDIHQQVRRVAGGFPGNAGGGDVGGDIPGRQGAVGQLREFTQSAGRSDRRQGRRIHGDQRENEDQRDGNHPVPDLHVEEVM